MLCLAGADSSPSVIKYKCWSAKERGGGRERGRKREKEEGSAGSLNIKTGLINSVDFTHEIDSKGSEL